MEYQFDDGSAIGIDTQGNVLSRDIGASAWVDNPTPAPAGWSVFSVDAQEQQRMGAAYPANGQSWDWNAATLGVSRLIDTASRAYVNANGSKATTYAGQNGQTYVSGTKPATNGGGLMPLLLIGAALLFLG